MTDIEVLLIAVLFIQGVIIGYFYGVCVERNQTIKLLDIVFKKLNEEVSRFSVENGGVNEDS